MALDFFWLYLHISILLFVIVREYSRPSQRNLFAILISGTFLVLVSGQAWWMLSRFEESGENGMMHLYQYISLPAARMANFYVGLAVIFFAIFYFIKRNRRYKTGVQTDCVSGRPINQRAYLFLFAWVVVISINLTMSAGGLIASLSAPGLNYAYGVTMYLILLSAGKLPLLYKIASRGEILKSDILLFLIVVFFTLLNARLNAGLILLQLVIIVNYCRHEISRKVLLLVPTFAVIIFIVFGLYREFASRQSGVIAQDELIAFVIDYADFTMVFDWFYAMNVEGFAGLAGVLTYDKAIGGISFDFGLSNISFITQFIPGALRTDPSLPLSQLSEYLRSIYPYQEGSIIRPGIEIAYSNFWVIGIVLFGALLGYFAQFFHAAMLRINSSTLAIGLISVQSFHSIRGPISNALFFGMSDLIMLLLFKIVLSAFKRTNYTVRSERVS